MGSTTDKIKGYANEAAGKAKQAAGRALDDPEQRSPDAVVVILAPDGNLAGMARATGSGQLQPKLVFDAAG